MPAPPELGDVGGEVWHVKVLCQPVAQQVGGADAYLMGGEMFAAGELREMEAAFGKANLAAYQVDSGRIKVPRGQQSVYMAALADAGAMPAEFGDFMKKAAANTSFIPPNRLQQEAIAKSARNHDLQLIVNKMRGILNVCAVKAPGYGDRRKAMLGDLAVLTGGTAIFKDLGIQLDAVKLSDLGRAKKLVIDAENTTVISGAGKKADIDGRAEQIRKEITVTDSEYDREKLQERLAKLAGGVAQINCGAATETEMKERKYLLDDAKSATQAALEEGIVPGGGVALIRCEKGYAHPFSKCRD